jgi:hypothetical protein
MIHISVCMVGFIFRQNEKLVRYKFTVMADNIYEHCRIIYYRVYLYLYISNGTDFNRIEDLHLLGHNCHHEAGSKTCKTDHSEPQL